ncbi:hypothetical protein Bbelb_285810 [Branchiostoma belcheri]|nr:hypothetical protein Bbelb_285810 [Branchiostoma belcheri]
MFGCSRSGRYTAAFPAAPGTRRYTAAFPAAPKFNTQSSAPRLPRLPPCRVVSPPPFAAPPPDVLSRSTCSPSYGRRLPGEVSRFPGVGHDRISPSWLGMDNGCLEHLAAITLVPRCGSAGISHGERTTTHVDSTDRPTQTCGNPTLD